MVGLVTSVSEDYKVHVDYGFDPKQELTFPHEELEVVFGDEGHWKDCPIQVCDAFCCQMRTCLTFKGMTLQVTEWAGGACQR